MRTTYFLCGITLLCINDACASPTTGGLLATRDVNCTGGAGAVYDDSCWATLNMTSWIKNWNATTPKCSGSADGSDCCAPSNNPNEPWSTCFLRLALGDSDYDCSQINLKSCSLEGFVLASNYNTSVDMPQYRYAVRNIYGEPPSSYSKLLVLTCIRSIE